MRVYTATIFLYRNLIVVHNESKKELSIESTGAFVSVYYSLELSSVGYTEQGLSVANALVNRE